MVICAVVDSFSSGVDPYLEKVKYIYVVYRPIPVVLSMLCYYATIIYTDVDDNVLERSQGISQEELV